MLEHQTRKVAFSSLCMPRMGRSSYAVNSLPSVFIDSSTNPPDQPVVVGGVGAESAVPATVFAVAPK